MNRPCVPQCQRALEEYDVVVLSGGSSVGMRDLVVDVLAALPGIEILAHGIAIRPGKPALFARLGAKRLSTCPGIPYRRSLSPRFSWRPSSNTCKVGRWNEGRWVARVTGRLATSMHSTIGLEEYVRVRLVPNCAGYEVHPVFGKSSMLSTMARADGILVVPPHAEGLRAGESVEVVLI